MFNLTLFWFYGTGYLNKQLQFNLKKQISQNHLLHLTYPRYKMLFKYLPSLAMGCFV